MNQDDTPVRPDYPTPPQNEPVRPDYPVPQQGEPLRPDYPVPQHNEPQNAPGYPAQQESGTYPPPPGGTYAGPPPARPGFDFQTLIARWRAVLYPPSIAAFDTQKPGANWNTIYISLALLGIVQAIFAFITGFEYHRAGRPLPGIGTIIGSFIGAFIGFFIAAGLIYLFARILGGTGEFLEHAWLLSLAWVPIQAISAVVGVIPFLGGIIQFVLVIYALFLYSYATASAHRMPLGRAAVAVLIPGIVLAAIVLILLAVAAAFFIGLGLSLPGS